MQFRIRELMVLMVVLPPIGGWLWFAHNVPPLPPAMVSPFGFHYARPNSGFDVGAIAVAVVAMGVVMMVANAFNRRVVKVSPPADSNAPGLLDE